jgi:ribosomal protein S21
MKLNAEVILDRKKSKDKAYFDRMYNKFSREVQKSGVLEDLKMRRCFYKPSKKKKVKKEFSRLKWLYYK